MSDHDPAGARPDFEGLEAWCRESRSWRIASATVLLLVGLGASAWAVSSGQAQLDPPTPLLFGVVLAATSLLPLAQALERSDWLRLVAALRGRWEAEDDPDARRRVAAGLERWIERLGGSR
ncbi:MAG: hypothetical protein H6712_25335 [Myxococcales bacterium]|nr:hypothetical protein [Myxococcales bacterium]MCB9717198.1 hypothetical protein [Myxococcales bacterium]